MPYDNDGNLHTLNIDWVCDCRTCRVIPPGWFKDWMQKWSTAAEPHSYYLMTAMATLSSALGRRVHVRHGIRQIYAMLNVLLVGGSAMGKSTAITQTARFLEPNIPLKDLDLLVLKGSITKEALYQKLEDNPHILLYATEFTQVFSKVSYKEELIGFMTRLLDYEPVITDDLKNSKLEPLVDTEVVVIGGSTREWLSTGLPGGATQGGFLPRFLVVLEEKKQRPHANPDRDLTEAQWDTLEARLSETALRFTDLCRATGRITIDESGADSFHEFTQRSSVGLSDDYRGFTSREQMRVKQMAMLFAVAAGKSEISDLEMDAAINLYVMFESKFGQLNVADNDRGKDQERVRLAINDASGLTMQEIARRVMGRMSYQEAVRLTRSLVDMGVVEYDPLDQKYAPA